MQKTLDRPTKTKQFKGLKLNLLKTKPTKGVFDPETKTVHTWVTSNIHHVSIVETFPNRNVGHVVIHAQKNIIEIEYPSGAPVLLDEFLEQGGDMKYWYKYYCKHADRLFKKDVQELSQLFPNWEIHSRLPSPQ